MKYKLFFIVILFALISCTDKTSKEIYTSDSLIITKLTENTFVHTSYLQTQNFGKVASNGLVYKNGSEAMVFDTPTTDLVSKELISWLKDNFNVTIKAVMITHSHVDCLGGLNAFHNAGIPSFANQLTIKFAQETDSTVVPQNSFQNELITKIGNESVVNVFMGEGHTKDNIVSYVPTEKVLFGGCLVKGLNAGKGYIEEANVTEWPNTVQQVKNRFPELKHVVPGHGNPGNVDLLDYTIDLFKKAEK
jgi:metallo-beta-lactamase class B